MKEKMDQRRIKVESSRSVTPIADEVNRAIKDGWTIKGMVVDAYSASTVYLDIQLSKTVGHSRDFFDSGFSSKVKTRKVRTRKPLQCIDKDGPCTQSHARKMGKDCSGCGG